MQYTQTHAKFININMFQTLKRKQAELQMNKLQLYYYFSLISSIILCIGIPFVGVPMQLLTIQWTYTKFVSITYYMLRLPCFEYNDSSSGCGLNFD